MLSRRVIVGALPLGLLAGIVWFLFGPPAPAVAAGSIINIAAGGETQLSGDVYSLLEGQSGSITFRYQGPGAAAVAQSAAINVVGIIVRQDETIEINGAEFTPRKTGTNRFALEIDAVRAVVPTELRSAQDAAADPVSIDFLIFISIFTNDPAYDAHLANALDFRLLHAESIGPWTLSRLDEAQRNNPCFRDALNLARTIAMSAKGQAAYGKVNLADADLEKELADGKGPEIDNDPLTGENAYGTYEGDSGGLEDQFKMADFLWDTCGPDASEQQKKNTIVKMANTILHETAHWKDDNKKFPKDAEGNEADVHDTEDEEGSQLDRDLWGGLMFISEDGSLDLDGEPVDAAQVDMWLDPANWPPPAAGTGNALPASRFAVAQAQAGLEVTIVIPDADFQFGEDLIAEVTYRNTTSAALDVMNRVVLEGYPLHFDVVNVDTGVRVNFAGPEVDLIVSNTDFTTLQPGQTLTVSVDLLRDSANGTTAYALTEAGSYEVTAVYERTRGVARTVSNSVPLQVSGRLEREVALVEGWNLVGWTGATAIGEATASIAGQFSALFTWNAQGGEFQSFNPTAPTFLNTLSELTTGDGVWLRVGDPSGATWVQPDLSAARVVPLVPGFNLVMWTGPDGMPVGDAIAGLEDTLVAIFTWDASVQAFLSFKPGAPAFLNSLSELHNGDGVWIEVSGAATWNQPAP